MIDLTKFGITPSQKIADMIVTLLSAEKQKILKKVYAFIYNNFYFDISGQMCISLRELENFLEFIEKGTEE